MQRVEAGSYFEDFEGMQGVVRLMVFRHRDGTWTYSIYDFATHDYVDHPHPNTYPVVTRTKREARKFGMWTMQEAGV